MLRPNNRTTDQTTDQLPDYSASPDFLLDLLDFWNLEIGKNNSSDRIQKGTFLKYIVTVCLSNRHYQKFGGPWVCAVSAPFLSDCYVRNLSKSAFSFVCRVSNTLPDCRLEHKYDWTHLLSYQALVFFWWCITTLSYKSVSILCWQLLSYLAKTNFSLTEIQFYRHILFPFFPPATSKVTNWFSSGPLRNNQI